MKHDPVELSVLRETDKFRFIQTGASIIVEEATPGTLPGEKYWKYAFELNTSGRSKDPRNDVIAHLLEVVYNFDESLRATRKELNELYPATSR